ncbi:MAG: hypothetical protein GY716_09470 [bacterium]|nr:hypothetical protein [bacterium]
MRLRGTAVASALALVMLLTPMSAVAADDTPRAADDPVLAQAFEVNYRTVTEAADVVSAVLSPDGVMTLKPKLKTLVVEDRTSVLAKVRSLLDSFDLPPRNVEITFTLLLGTDRREEAGVPKTPSGVVSRDIRGLIETLGEFTNWISYESLGSRSVVGVEGDEVVANLSDDYRVTLLLDLVHEERGIVRIKRLALQRRVQDEAGAERVEDLHTTGMLLSLGKLNVVGAASGPDAKQALFLAVQAQPR